MQAVATLWKGKCPFFGLLPHSITALHTICRLPAPLIEQLILEKAIHLDLSPREANALVRKHLGLGEEAQNRPNLWRRIESLEECLDWMDEWPDGWFPRFDEAMQAIREQARLYQSKKGAARGKSPMRKFSANGRIPGEQKVSRRIEASRL
jgi:hypothetical protein